MDALQRDILAWLDVCRNGWPVNSKDARLGTDRTLDALETG